MAHFDEIASYLDVENSITARWLANTLRIGLENARSSLENYKKANPNIAVSYLVVGASSSGGLSYIVTTESELDSVRINLSPVRSEELYSIHKVRSAINRAEIQALEYEQASEMLLMSHPNSHEFLSNVGGYIVCSAIDVKPVGQRILSANHSSQISSQAKETIKASVSKSITEKSTVQTPSASVSATSTTAAAAPAVLKSKSSIQATNFFAAKAAPAPAKAATAVEPEIVNETKPVAPTQVAGEIAAKEAPPKRVGKVAIDDDEDEEWDSGYKPDPQRLKERVDTTVPARAVISTGSEEMDLSDDVEEDALDVMDPAAAAKKRSKGKGKMVLHGAMDDYMEDVAIAEHNRAEANPDAAKPKKRKLVEKMFADEKGYLVTEMVWEEVTDDESDAAPAVTAAQPPTKRPHKEVSAPEAAAGKEKKTIAPAGKAAAAKKGASEASKPQQKSMMSFFAKKAE